MSTSKMPGENPAGTKDNAFNTIVVHNNAYRFSRRSDRGSAPAQPEKGQVHTLSSAAQNPVMSSIEPTVTRDTVGQIGQERPISTLWVRNML